MIWRVNRRIPGRLLGIILVQKAQRISCRGAVSKVVFKGTVSAYSRQEVAKNNSLTSL